MPTAQARDLTIQRRETDLVVGTFGRGAFIWGEPIHIPTELGEAEMEAWRALVEDRMNALTAEADRRVGHEAIAPGTLTRREWNMRRRAARAGGRA